MMCFTTPLLECEKKLLDVIRSKTSKYNVDNIARTNSYRKFFNLHKNIKWSFLASMVSRNAGWNMCDLEGSIYREIIQPEMRRRLFLTYERANWLIFQDAFPQLLLYHYSTKLNRPMFHLLRYFHVSQFMENEWNQFWLFKDENRLLTSLIINEQNVIQEAVLEHPVYKKRVFRSLPFLVQDALHFSVVLFPTCRGELYGASVNKFNNVTRRIDLGKRLASILFDFDLFHLFYEFSERTVHTGSRYDYERFFLKKVERVTPFLRMTYPIINHDIKKRQDWKAKKNKSGKWFNMPIEHIYPIKLTSWYEKKQKQLAAYTAVKQLFN
ncbi:DUF2515 family protein [Bacillus aquiflavi]|uniref:DUF2515 domain-containing protein n=1 Tax=Bacillus aquiflavi TaxID=2672567 RepID=A0A6B3VYQ1_9BACI|nr:DUF2515 family protein [Bacillus aquiflavi]MBA4536120.1 DUF2515 family protein [Bacillus aquiflavi]NEY80494.1 DUF2515 domain-containing protein [Bacillus aquiflavi]UAC47039.1 DUF2515 domain-containing protein [Bacillus aquiflavi]